MLSKRRITGIGLAITLAMFAAGCKKKAPAPPPPPPPAPAPAPAPKPAAPTVASFSAEPSSIERGQSSTLRWEVSGNVSNVSINAGVGVVQNTGSQRVSPSDSTTYTLTATGDGGTTTASATVTVVAPPPPPPPPPPPAPAKSLEERITELQDAYFDYDKSDVRSDAQATLTQDATALKSIIADFPNAAVTLEGHCDERGSAEYNVALGEKRSSSAKDFLVQLGISADKLKTISYGKERPACTDHDEACWQKNRRVHFSTGQ